MRLLIFARIFLYLTLTAVVNPATLAESSTGATDNGRLTRLSLTELENTEVTTVLRSKVKAILAGERDPYPLAALRNWRGKASAEEIARSLEGNWQEEHLFVLQPEQDGYQFCLKQMAECDQRRQQYLQQQEDRSQGASLPEEKRKERLRRKKKGNTPQFDLRAELFRMTGTDLTQIDGIDAITTLTILSEAGWDMSKWKTEHHFVSWLRLCPDNRIRGGKIIGKGRLPTNNRVTNALRMKLVPYV